MKILFITSILADGGAERVVSVLSDELTKQGHDVAILIGERRPNEYYINPQTRVYQFDDNYDPKKGNAITRTCKRIKMTRNVIKNFKPTVVIPFLTSPVRETFVAKIGLKVKQVSTIRNNPREMPKSRKIIQDFVFLHSDSIFLQTESQKKFIPHRTIKKSFVLPNPVNIKAINVKWEKKRDEYIDLISLGRLHKQKNYPMLIEAVSIVHDKYPNIRLQIWGRGPMQDELQTLIENKKTSHYISLCGRTSNPAEELLKSDIFVFSSDYEGMPNALMEAMAVGMPCISTDCPTGPKELIGDSERGLLVPVGDANAMADAIITMIENPTKPAEMGMRAKKYVVDNFSPEVIAKKLMENLR